MSTAGEHGPPVDTTCTEQEKVHDSAPIIFFSITLEVAKVGKVFQIKARVPLLRRQHTCMESSVPLQRI
jgi:hypothetical protein